MTDLEKDTPLETVSEIHPSNGNDEGSAGGFKIPDVPPPLLSLTEGQNNFEDLLNSIDILETQAAAGYAPSPYVPFRVQVQARNVIPDSELSNVPNSKVRSVDDSKGDAGTVTPGQTSGSPEGAILAGASVPIPDIVSTVTPGQTSGSSEGAILAGALVPIPDTVSTLSSGQDKTQQQASQVLTGAEPGLIASTVGVGLQGQDISSEPSVNSDLVNNGLIIGNGDTDQTFALAFADQAPSSGKSGAQLADPLFANPNIPSLNSGLSSGSIFASASATGDSLFFDSVSDIAAAPSGGTSTQASVFSPDDAATGGDGNGNSNPNNQDESFLRNTPDTVDWEDPCNLMHGSDTPFFKCTLSTSRTVLAPFKIPSVPRPDNDIAIDDIANVP